MMRRGCVGVLWGSMLAAWLCASGCDGSCEDGGRVFADGAAWTCSDGCNYCSCEDGVITSTLAECPRPPGPAAGKLSCNADGRFHRHGERYDCPAPLEGPCECDDGRSVPVEPEGDDDEDDAGVDSEGDDD